jgi:uncharacterized repeat protein (TIGR01451 family)
VISTLPTRRSIGLRPPASWAGAAALTLGFLFGSSTALAAAPPANTVIGNQASATYSDAAGTTQLATSNLVQTTVQQVGSFTLDSVNQVTTTVVNTKSGAAGSTVYAPHTLTNTGNGSDTFTLSVTAPASPNGFTKVEVFADANADGVPDSTSTLCSVVPGAPCNVLAQTVAGGGTFAFVVAYSIPSTASAATFTSPVAATITATAGTPALYAASNQSAADVDNVNLTIQAAFNATKSLSVPAVSWVSGAAWPVASASGPRSAATCTSTPTLADATTPAAGCVYTTYTLRFNNTGGAAGKFAMTDTLPSGFTYVPGSAVWSNSPSGTALTDASGGDTTGIDFKAAGNTLTVVVASLAPNVTQTVSFVVMVNNTAALGTSTTTNTANYNPQAAAPAADSNSPGATNSPTNPASYNVVGTFGVILGSADASASPTASKDTGAGNPNNTAADTTTVASAGVGTTVKFTQTVFNTGNAADLVNLVVASNTFPSGTTFRFFAADGATPLIDNNSDGIFDTSVPAGGSVQFVLAATLPSPVTLPTGPFNVVVSGTSTGDGSKTESTRDTLTAMVGVLVDLTNTASGNGTAGNTGNGDVGTGPSPLPTTTKSTPAGTGVIFTLFVKNNDSVANTYSLAASQSNSFPGNLPSGWTVKFVDAGATCSGAAKTTVSVPSGASLPTQVDACVTPPASQAPVTGQRIYFQVQSTIATSTGVVAMDTKTDAVDVTTANTFGATLTPNSNGQVSPGGSVVYAHTLAITGAQSCGTKYSVSATLPSADVTAGWTTALYVDVNGDGQIDSGDTLVTSGTVTPAGVDPLGAGKTQKLLVKVFAPGGATAGATDTATVTVTFPDVAACGTPSATDVSTVITGQMRLVKTQALDPSCTGTVVPSSSAPLVAKPGECLVYRVVATNEGAAPVTNMSINDAVPAYTSLTGATQPTNRCVSTGVTPTFTTAANYTSTATTVACGSTTNTVTPGGTATLTFAVKINE